MVGTFIMTWHLKGGCIPVICTCECSYQFWYKLWKHLTFEEASGTCLLNPGPTFVWRSESLPGISSCAIAKFFQSSAKNKVSEHFTVSEAWCNSVPSLFYAYCALVWGVRNQDIEIQCIMMSSGNFKCRRVTAMFLRKALRHLHYWLIYLNSLTGSPKIQANSFFVLRSWRCIRGCMYLR